MEDKDLGSKKMNNKQKTNEGFSGENIPEDYNPSKSIMKTETETDKEGNTKVVKRPRNVEKTNTKPEKSEVSNSGNRGVSSEKEVLKTVENQDFNSDVVPNRFPKSNPDNKGNNTQ